MSHTDRTMRAVRFAEHGGPEVLEVAQVPVPDPGPGEVLVRVHAAALNNTDVWTREGDYGLPGPRAGWRGPMDLPRIQGADAAGEVAAVGPDVDAALAGRRVVVDPAVYDGDGPDAQPVGLMGSERDGGYAEYVLAPADHVHDQTDSPLDDAQLASLPCAYGTAWGMLERGRLTEGETVVVSGASGGVGLAAVQLASARGARVVAISSAGKIDAVHEAGAEVVVDRAGDVPEALRDAAPDGIDVGIDVVAGDLVAASLPLLRDGGRWVVAGALAGHDIGFDVRALYLRNLQLIGSAMHTRAHFAGLMALARRGGIRPVVAETFALADAADAQRSLETRRHVGKIVLVP